MSRCPKCKQRPTGPYKKCTPCRLRYGAWNRARTERYRMEGKCRCGRPVSTNAKGRRLSECERCIQVRNETRARKRRLELRARLQELQGRMLLTDRLRKP